MSIAFHYSKALFNMTRSSDALLTSLLLIWKSSPLSSRAPPA